MRRSFAALAAAALAALGLTACAEESVFSIDVGSCASSESFTDAESGVVQSLPLIDCEEPHDLEAIASMEIEGGETEGDEYPGDPAIKEIADAFCVEAFESFVDLPYAQSEFQVLYFAPTQESWDSTGDREVLCWLMSDEPVTGSQEGAAR